MVRVAGASDLDRIVEIELSCSTAPHWDRKVYAAMFSENSAQLQRCVLVAEDGERRVVGFAVASSVEGLAELESVAVDPAWQGRGFGRELCEGVLRWCSHVGSSAITLEVRAGSEGPQRLYRALGFVEVDRRKGYYKGPVEDAILMGRELAGEERGSRARSGIPV